MINNTRYKTRRQTEQQFSHLERRVNKERRALDHIKRAQRQSRRELTMAVIGLIISYSAVIYTIYNH